MLNSAQFGRLLEPGLRKVFNEAYTEIPEQYSKIFKVQDSNKAIETDLRMGGFGLWEKKDSAGSVVYQDTIDPQAIQYIHEEFASGFTVERKLVDDEMYNQIAKKPQKLGRSARVTIETKAADVLNNAFNAARPGFDGVPLISTSHVRLDGGSMSNRLPSLYGGVADGALSDRNLKAALIHARKQVDDKGLLIQVVPKLLVVPPELEFIAKTIVGGANLSAQGTGSGMTNDTNVIQSRLEVVVMDYLTYQASANKYPWFVIDPSVAELNFFWRKRLEFGTAEDFDTMVAKYRGYCRFSVGYSDYRGIVGSDGTGAA